MRALKLVAGSFIILFLLTTIIGLLFPSTVRVTRTVNIAASYDTVYHYLKDVKYWKLWMQGADTNTISFLSARTAGQGTVIKMGTGEVTITHCSPDTVLSIWKSEGGNIQNSAFIIKSNSPNIITLQWYFEQQISWYPWARIGSLSNDKILGPVIEESLTKLKRVLEKS